MKTNQMLQRDILDELSWEPSVDAGSIGVAVADGVVTLSGHVATYVEKFAAEKAAMRVAGVHGVANDLDVRLPSTAMRDDTDIARAALDSLAWHVDVPKDRIKVVVKDSRLTLEGQVDWSFQRKTAENAVRHIVGVRGVTNLIVVKPPVRPADIRSRIEAALKRSAEVEARQIRVEAHDGSVTLRGTVHSFAERKAVERAAWSAPGVTAVDDEISVREPALI